MIVRGQRRVKPDWAPYGKTEVWQDYYHVRSTSAADHSAFWQPQADPDGVVRDRNTELERLQYLADIADEIAFIKQLQPTTVCDFGAGLGWLLAELDCQCKLAVEIAPDAARKLEADGVTVFDRIADVPSNSCDVVVAYHVFEHIVDPIDALRHVIRILHRKAWLVLGTPDFGSPCAVRFGERYRLLHSPTHVSLFTLESMTRMLRDYAFDIHDIRFPFPERYATAETMARWLDVSRVSPPWPGNFVTWYAQRA